MEIIFFVELETLIILLLFKACNVQAFFKSPHELDLDIKDDS